MSSTEPKVALQVIKGFDTAVTGLSVGDSRKSRIPPIDAYGETDPAMVMSFPREGKGADGLKEGVKVLRMAYGRSQQIASSILPYILFTPHAVCMLTQKRITQN